MSEETYVPNALRKAPRESLLYNLTEKIAYGLHKKNPQQDQNLNCFRAQEYFERWLIGRFGEYIFPLSKFLQNMLDHADQSYKESGENILDIKYEFANMIIKVNESNSSIASLF